ncbi:uncharacterized protein TRAVEDRAFT_68143 [Trametes versicolor FP-101664 SS1]|uniref:uncharacterized protein n=1 Tax=Trametes versicolor (strain FP-101664) TaxID=717944 RepID=UPI00046247C3|nr:uncharacterized protein TRAVEDRAFT_68143 [Trametes versicolor FP-101664 SS1]EIW64301.1 hypothetical protein TRAVEDRAFT_68143 [Trametes versicolor FP-101664 SS1]
MDGPYAFATLVTSDHYLPGALAVAAAIKDLHASPAASLEVAFQTVCLVTPETVDVSSIKLLRRAFDLVIGVEVIEDEGGTGLQLLGRPDLSQVLTKLHVFRLTQFAKIVFLDADVLPIRALSHLFTIPHEFAAVPDVGWPDIFNSGVMVLTPGEDKFEELRELLKTKGTWDGGDQGLLNEWRGGNWHRLSFTYNTTPTAAYTYAPAYERFGSEISAIHFIGPNKPWVSISYRPPGTKYGQSSSNTVLDPKAPAYNYDSLVDRWFDVYDRHYRSEESAQHADFEFSRYDSAWDFGSGFDAEMARPPPGPPPGGALGLDDLRKIAVEGINGYNASAQQPQWPSIGEYRSMPLEGRVDLMRPRKEPPPAQEKGGEEGGHDQGGDQGGDQNLTPKQAFRVLEGGELPRMETLPTPLPSEVPGAPYHGPLSLPPSGASTPYQYPQPGQDQSHLPQHYPQLQTYDDTEWQDSDFQHSYLQHLERCRDIGHRKAIGDSGRRPLSSTAEKASSLTLTTKTTPHRGSRRGKRKTLGDLAGPHSRVSVVITTIITTTAPKASLNNIRLRSVCLTSTIEMHRDRVGSRAPPSSLTTSTPVSVISLLEAFTHLGVTGHLRVTTPPGVTTLPRKPAIPRLCPFINPAHNKPTTLILFTSLRISNSTSTSPRTSIMINLIHPTPPPTSAFPLDTYFPNVWDQAPSQEHDATHQSFPPHLVSHQSETFFNPPPPAEIPEQLLREGQYSNVIGRPAESSPGSPSAHPAPDPTKLHAIFPWEEKPRPMPRRVFPISDSPPPIANFVEEPRPVRQPPRPRVASQSHVPPPSAGLPLNLNLAYQNAWDTVPSIQHYATKLVRPHHSIHQPPPPDHDVGWRKWDEERERVYQEKQDASSMDGDDEDEGDDDDDDAHEQTSRWDSESSKDRTQARRPRAGSSASTSSVQGKKYHGRGIQTDQIETRSMGVQVNVWAESVAAATQKLEDPKPSRGVGTSTRQRTQPPSGIGLLPPVTMREFKRDPDQMGVASTPAVTQPMMGVMPFPSSASPTGIRSPQFLGSPRTYTPPRAASPLRIPSPPKIASPKPHTPPKVSSPKGPHSPKSTMVPRRLSAAQMPTSRLAGSPKPASPKPGSPVVGLSVATSPRQSPKLTRLTAPFNSSPPLHRSSSNDTVVASSPSTQGPVETPEGTPVLGTIPLRKGGRVWDPARGVDVFKRSSEEVLARFLRTGSFDEDEVQRRHV